MTLFIARTWPLIAAFFLYVLEVVILCQRGDYWQAVTYVGYAIGNIGLIAVAAR